MGADKNYHGPAISNPLCDQYYKVHWADKTYSLEELSEYCAVIPREYKRKAPDITEGRHMYLFHTLRLWAYPQVRNVATYEELEGVVKDKAKDIFYNEIMHMEGTHPYLISEAMSAATSIVKFIWKHKNDPGFKQYTWNKGVMNYKPINYEGLSEAEVDKVYLERKISGAHYAADQKRSKTEDIIRDAIEFLIKDKKRLTLKNISSVTGISYRQVNRYKDFIDTVKKEIGF